MGNLSDDENSRAKLGALGEEFARAKYERAGYKVIATHVFNRRGKQFGELDFVAVRGQAIVFVEVKTRLNSAGRFGPAAASVGWQKQQRLLRMVQLFLRRHQQFRGFTPRIDVCVVECGFDKLPKNAIIIPNAVEDDW